MLYTGNILIQFITQGIKNLITKLRFKCIQKIKQK